MRQRVPHKSRCRVLETMLHIFQHQPDQTMKRMKPMPCKPLQVLESNEANSGFRIPSRHTRGSVEVSEIAQMDGCWNASSKVSPTKSTPSFWSKRAAPCIKFPAHGKLKTNICMIFQFRLTFNAKSHSKKIISSFTLVPQIRPLLENCCDVLPSFFHDAIDVSVRC